MGQTMNKEGKNKFHSTTDLAMEKSLHARNA